MDYELQGRACLVTGAGGSRPTTPESGDDVWDEAFALNSTAMRRLTTALLPAMRKAGRGRIVNSSGSTEPRGLNAAIAANGEQSREKPHPTEESRRSFVERNIPIGYSGEPGDVAHLVAFHYFAH
jgi:3-oxoacyl-[acyl-carrier protein] reductase